MECERSGNGMSVYLADLDIWVTVIITLYSSISFVFKTRKSQEHIMVLISDITFIKKNRTFHYTERSPSNYFYRQAMISDSIFK